jgi:hypothetical protein
MKIVYLIGTDHSYQLGPCEEFEKILTDLCHDEGVKAIAEGMNAADALIKEGVKETVPKRIAHRLGLLHRYCDPDQSKQNELGIQNEGLIRSQSLFCKWLPEKVDARIQEEHRKRERIWLDEINNISVDSILFICGSNHVLAFEELLNLNHILFICGSNHVLAFEELLNLNHYHTVIMHEDWAPNHRLHK